VTDYQRRHVRGPHERHRAFRRDLPALPRYGHDLAPVVRQVKVDDVVHANEPQMNLMDVAGLERRRVQRQGRIRERLAASEEARLPVYDLGISVGYRWTGLLVAKQ
jgi:hypothetical protein